jgi:hypothetical protein
VTGSANHHTSYPMLLLLALWSLPQVAPSGHMPAVVVQAGTTPVPALVPRQYLHWYHASTCIPSTGGHAWWALGQVLD